ISGGEFTETGGADRYFLAALDTATGSATSWDPVIHGYAHSLACMGSTLYVGGDFDSVGGVACSFLARFDTPVPPTVTSVDPSLGINEASVAVTVVGTGFKEGAAVRLRKTGEDDIEATNVDVLDATTITCDLDLNGAPVGQWDVVVVNPDGQEGVLEGGFTIYQRPLSDEFDESALNPRWIWMDPLSDCAYDLAGSPGYLRISVPGNYHDLHPANNLNAPRLLQPIYQDFTVETRVLVDPQHDACGAGILAWKDQDNFLRLERGMWYNDQVISFWGVVGGVETPYASVGSTSTEAYVRLSRVGEAFSAYCSPDGVNWTLLATRSMSVDEPVQVGLHVVNKGEDYPFQADFDHFRCDRYFVRAMVVGGQGTVSPETQVVEKGGDADVFITPDPGWHIAGITDNGNPVTVADPSGTTYTLKNVAENHLVEVAFELNTYAVTCYVSPQGSGTVTGSGTYAHGSQVTLTAVPAAGYHFLRWTEGGNPVSTANPYQFTATANRTLMTVFEEEVSPQTTFYFAEGYTGKDTFEEYLCLMNPNEEQTTAHITYMFSDGSTKEQDLPIGKTSRATVNVKAAVGENKDVSIKVTSDLPIVCERPMYFNYAGAWTGGHVVMGLSP
uniref:InlB B-repeat-containing protein n=1 Tax=Candidatus Solincola tengchongensis TaxID=2900693 RepID=UPI00257D9E7C